MIRLLVTTLVLGAPLLAAVPPVAAAPVEHRLTPDQIAAAQADGAERNRAADLLAMTRGDPRSRCRSRSATKQVHGEAEVGIGSHGCARIRRRMTTAARRQGSATVAGSYSQLRAPTACGPAPF